MKLRDLKPQWMKHEVRKAGKYHGRPIPGTDKVQWGGFPVDTYVNVKSRAEAHGIRFLCPKCFLKNGLKGTHEVHVWFKNEPVPAHIGKNSKGQTVRWAASGTTFDTISTTPSILLIGGCCWHGYITNGEVSVI